MAAVYIPFVTGMLRKETVEAARATAPIGVEVHTVEVDYPHDTLDGVYRTVNGVRHAIGYDGTGYHRLIEELWRKQETFIIIEQDNVVGEHTLERLLNCRRPWCSAGYLVGDELGNGGGPMMGCCKFSRSIMVRYPHLMDRVSEFGCVRYREAPFTHVDCANPTGKEHDGMAPRVWPRLDQRMQWVLIDELHCKAHIHAPIEHLHDYTHGDGCQCARCMAMVVAPLVSDPTNVLTWIT